MTKLLNIKKASTLSSIKPRVFLRDYLPILQSSVMMIYAYGGVGKSFLSIRMAYEFCRENKGRTVALWLSEDSEAENLRRADLICADMGIDRHDYDDQVQFISSAPVRFTSMEGNNAVMTEDFYICRKELNSFSMVVLDPLLQFSGCDENSNTYAGVFMGAMKEWAAEEMKAILLLHHATPTEGNLPNGMPNLKPRGAREWTNGTRGVYQLNRVHDENTENGKRKLRATLVKDNGISYYVRDDFGNLHRDLSVFPEFKQPADEITVPFLSVAHHNSAKIPTGFEYTEMYFRDMHNYIIGNQCYSQYNFRNGHRRGENNLGAPTVICLDIDHGMTFKDAEKRFKSVEALIVTTRNHQQPKGDTPPCDRFRVILNLRTPLSIPMSEISTFLDYLYAEIGCVDPSTKDLARFYFASPLDARYAYTKSTARFDWESAYERMKRKAAMEKVKGIIGDESTGTYTDVPKNAVPEEHIFATAEGFLSFKEIRDRLPVGGKMACRCMDDIDHGGMGPGHYSAFVKKADNGNVFYSCSGGRCADKGTVWAGGWENKSVDKE